MPDIGADLQSAYEEGFHVGYDQAMSEMPEIIRCKDCYYFIPPKDRDIRTLYSCRETWSKHIIVDENDFCSKAIRIADVQMRREKAAKPDEEKG